MKSTRAAVLVAVVSWLGWIAPAHSAVEVNTCGQQFSGDGFLSADLDCSGHVGSPIEIVGSGSLDLRGFTITARNVDLSGLYEGAYAVFCESSCNIYGGGGAIIANGSPATGDGIAALFAKGNIFVTDLTLRESSYLGIRANGKAEVINSTLADNLQGIGANRTLRVTNSSVTGNEWGGVGGLSVIVRGSTISGNSQGGVGGGRRIRLIDSSVTGNELDPACGVSAWCADVATTKPPFGRKPRLVNSTCDRSRQEGTISGTWCVCALDGC